MSAIPGWQGCLRGGKEQCLFVAADRKCDALSLQSFSTLQQLEVLKLKGGACAVMSMQGLD